MPATVEASRLQEISDGLHKRSKVLLVVVIVVAAVFGVAYLSRSSTKAAGASADLGTWDFDDPASDARGHQR
jgi:hypothetical protein